MESDILNLLPARFKSQEVGPPLVDIAFTSGSSMFINQCEKYVRDNKERRRWWRVYAEAFGIAETADTAGDRKFTMCDRIEMKSYGPLKWKRCVIYRHV